LPGRYVFIWSVYWFTRSFVHLSAGIITNELLNYWTNDTVNVPSVVFSSI
jgi:hypothetical protein